MSCHDDETKTVALPPSSRLRPSGDATRLTWADNHIDACNQARRKLVLIPFEREVF